MEVEVDRKTLRTSDACLSDLTKKIGIILHLTYYYLLLTSISSSKRLLSGRDPKGFLSDNHMQCSNFLGTW